MSVTFVRASDSAERWEAPAGGRRRASAIRRRDPFRSSRRNVSACRSAVIFPPRARTTGRAACKPIRRHPVIESIKKRHHADRESRWPPAVKRVPRRSTAHKREQREDRQRRSTTRERRPRATSCLPAGSGQREGHLPAISDKLTAATNPDPPRKTESVGGRPRSG